MAIHSFDLVVKNNRGEPGDGLDSVERGDSLHTMHETQSERTWIGSMLNKVQLSEAFPCCKHITICRPLALIRRRPQSWPAAIKAIPNCFSNATYLNRGKLAVPFLVPACPPPILCGLSRLKMVVLSGFTCINNLMRMEK
ncbi:unnamed protein product [Fusarium venenatum]|uniref:Uncharacterized protein n=1 Tax=Fusarium venenatum TaxID=56646 RepID=A0A2L2SPV3_9HYPO|nr:LOW QUALITY PROTEIN: uncharacterized protein FVRRES_11501 [Fusarium venenatum]CEI38810.1 unnamed protein product [Fusarium venenatum]